MENQLGLVYFIGEEILEIFLGEMDNIILSISVELEKKEIKKLVRTKNCYAYINEAFKKPLDEEEVDYLKLILTEG